MLEDMKKKHIQACVSLFLDVFQNEPWHYEWMVKEKIERYFQDLFSTPCFKGYVYYEAFTLIGLCAGVTCDYFASKSYEIKEIVIRRDRQGKGYGKKMLNRIEEMLKKENVQTITLATQREIAAYGFYRRNAFTETEGTVYMCKTI